MSNNFTNVSKLRIYEENGKDLSYNDKNSELLVHNHSRRDLVVLEINGKKHAVLADHLEKAIQNSRNAHIL